MADTTIIPQQDTNWLYLQPDADNTALYTAYNSNPSGDNFTQIDYDDSGWSSGTGAVGYASGDFGVTTVCNDPGTGLRDQALYLRKHFYVNNVDSITDWTFQVNIDDGAVIYLNGTEIGRYGMAAGTVIDSTLANTVSGNSAPPHPSENQWYTIDFSTPNTDTATAPYWQPGQSDPWTLLVDGENVLTMSVHQITNDSSDQKGDVSFYVTGEATASSSSSSTNQSSSSSSKSSSSSSRSSSSSSSSSVSSSSSSNSSSSSSAWYYKDPGGVVWGEENPTEGEEKYGWNSWSDGVGGTPEASEWGTMCLELGSQALSPVVHFGDGNLQTVSVTLGRYALSPGDQGSFDVYIRGQNTIFNQDDGSPSWEAYTGSAAKTWEYIQIRLVSV